MKARAEETPKASGTKSDNPKHGPKGHPDRERRTSSRHGPKSHENKSKHRPKVTQGTPHTDTQGTKHGQRPPKACR